MHKTSALLVGWLLIFSGQAVFAQTPKLIESAKKEGGKVIVYTTMEPFIKRSRLRCQYEKTAMNYETYK